MLLCDRFVICDPFKKGKPFFAQCINIFATGCDFRVETQLCQLIAGSSSTSKSQFAKMIFTFFFDLICTEQQKHNLAWKKMKLGVRCKGLYSMTQLFVDSTVRNSMF